MTDDRRALPPTLSEAHEVGFDYRDGAGVDFEPYPEFLDAGETAEWWRAWTGNAELDGSEFRVFGQDGTGGLAAFWLVRDGEPIERQPVVFLGSEGETGVVAQNLRAYLWLLADGFGPWEATAYPDHEHEPRADARLTEIAQRWAPSHRRSASEVIAGARYRWSRCLHPARDVVARAWNHDARPACYPGQGSGMRRGPHGGLRRGRRPPLRPSQPSSARSLLSCRHS
ncbi:SMI1/KNR4 family protein [Micromonospora chersina]|uniref:SMI1/KNR4 family protein n=1 Tax=Micromonospora chersina TaxID=47854 RepID=UPI0033CDA249